MIKKKEMIYDLWVYYPWGQAYYIHIYVSILQVVDANSELLLSVSNFQGLIHRIRRTLSIGNILSYSKLFL